MGVQNFNIKQDDIGYSYDVVFGKCLDGSVTDVMVKDPYIKARHQLNNWSRFCSLVVKKCQKVKLIHLTTQEEHVGKMLCQESICACIHVSYVKVTGHSFTQGLSNNCTCGITHGSIFGGA